MRITASRAKRGVLLLSPLALFISMAASAAIAPAAREAMQRDLGLTARQVTQYEAIERLAELQGRQLQKAQGAGYAGSWIEKDSKGVFRFVVASTSVQPKTGPAGVSFRSVGRSLRDL